MESEWRNLTLGDIAHKDSGAVDGPFGSNLPASSYVANGIPVIRGSNLTVGSRRFKGDDFVFVAEETFQKLKRSECLPNDIIVTKKGTLGQTGFISKDEKSDRYLLSSNQMRIRVNTEITDPEYVYYWLSSEAAFNQIKRESESTGVPKINLNYLKNFPIKLPSLKTQLKIVSILGAIDNKIQLNRQTNQTLQTMAQALFKSWFVDFDPVIDNALAAGNPIPDELEERAARRQLQLAKADHKPLPDSIRQLFPSEFELTEELGWVPKGWGIKSIKELSSKLTKGTTPRQSDLSGITDAAITPFLKVRDITNGGDIIKNNVDHIPESISLGPLRRSVLKTNDILVSIAGTIGRVTVIESDLDGSNCNQAIAFIRLLDNEGMLELVKLNLQSPRVQNEISSKIVQAVQANFSLTQLGEINILLPSSKILSRFSSEVKACIEKKSLASSETRQLTKLRDTLLPKLISGELRLSAEAMAEA
jgi:type I restriction enzyme S subunit